MRSVQLARPESLHALQEMVASDQPGGPWWQITSKTRLGYSAAFTLEGQQPPRGRRNHLSLRDRLPVDSVGAREREWVVSSDTRSHTVVPVTSQWDGAKHPAIRAAPMSWEGRRGAYLQPTTSWRSSKLMSLPPAILTTPSRRQGRKLTHSVHQRRVEATRLAPDGACSCTAPITTVSHSPSSIKSSQSHSSSSQAPHSLLFEPSGGAGLTQL